MNSLETPIAQLVGGLLVAAAVGVAFLIGADPGSAWWLVTVAQGDPDRTLNVLCAIFGFTWVAAAIVLPRRG